MNLNRRLDSDSVSESADFRIQIRMIQLFVNPNMVVSLLKYFDGVGPLSDW